MEQSVIARVWRGRATAENADAYHRHFMMKVAPHLRDISGHKGAYLLRRLDKDGVEFTAITLWQSREAIDNFAGSDPERAVVEPEARAALSSFDEFVSHYEVVYAGV